MNTLSLWEERSTGLTNWYAVRTRSNFERTVAREIEAKRIEVYLPAYDEVRQWKDRKTVVSVPLFPGYVFARFADNPDQRLAILKASGSVQILGCGGGIESIPKEQIDAVYRMLKSKVHCFPYPFLKEGDAVRVKRGALRGLEGLLVRVKNQTRLVISVSLLSQSVAAEVDARDVEPINKNRTDGVAAPCNRCIRI
jgi:transcription antitermination factor NusG